MTAPTDSLFEVVLEFFREKGWKFSQLEGRTVLEMSVRVEGTSWSCFADARESLRQVLFYSVAPVTAGAERRSQVVEFITRANYGLIVGNFEMDLDHGEVRFKTSLDVGATSLTSEQMERLVDANVRAMARYLPGLSAVDAGADAREMIARIESESA